MFSIFYRYSRCISERAEYHFENPALTHTIREENGDFYLDIEAKAFAKSVMIEYENADVEPEDNFFDITNGKISVLLHGKKEDILSETPKILTAYDVQ